MKNPSYVPKSSSSTASGVAKSLAPVRDVSEKAREKAAAKHDALPDGSFPIQNRAQLMRARRAVGRAKDPAAARALIRRRAAQLHVSLKGSALDKDGVSKSAFGVEHEVSKARAYTEAGRRKKAEDAELRQRAAASMSRGERVKVGIGGVAVSPFAVPKGSRRAAARTFLAHTSGRHGTPLGAHQKVIDTYGRKS